MRHARSASSCSTGFDSLLRLHIERGNHGPGHGAYRINAAASTDPTSNITWRNALAMLGFPDGFGA